MKVGDASGFAFTPRSQWTLYKVTEDTEVRIGAIPFSTPVVK
jgi:hypothetical protein